MTGDASYSFINKYLLIEPMFMISYKPLLMLNEIIWLLLGYACEGTFHPASR